MNFDDPQERAQLAQTLTPSEYGRAFAQFLRDSTVATVNGHAIRPRQTRFGRLFAVGDTGRAFRTLAEAATFAESPCHE